MINISIAGRDENDRKAVTSLLTEYDDFRVASEGKDGYDAIKSAADHRPDIIITDFVLNDIASPDLAPIIRRYSPQTKHIVLCSRTDCVALGRAIRAGISGCLLKESGLKNLASSVWSVYYGGLYVDGRVRSRLLELFGVFGHPSRQNENGMYCFSPTELQIFSGIALGYTDAEIAKRLNISAGTVRNSVEHVKQRTGLQNRTQITLYALLGGMIDSEKIRRQFAKVPDRVLNPRHE
jgi:two-component system response regulator NreC